MLVLTEEQIRPLLRWDELIPAMEAALAAFSAGRVIQPVRNMITIEEGRRYLGVMPAVAEAAMGLKLVSFYPGNAGTSVPTHLATILLFRSDTGQPLAVMDGRLITEMRTAAVSAAVTKYLSAPDSRVLALLGSGVQAEAHLKALSRVRQFDDVRVWSRNPEHARSFAERHNANAQPDARQAVLGADVVVTATSAIEPILKGAWLKRGAHANAVGSPRPTWRELDDETMRCTVVVDSREAVLKESGDVILSKADIYAEVGEIFSGAKPARASETTVFKSVGIAAEDIAAAMLVYGRAVAQQQSGKGGPLFNAQGEVIGVNTAIFSPIGANVGIGFAVPSRTAQAVAEQLIRSGKVDRGYLGVRLQEITPALSQALRLREPKGALIASVEPGSPAEKAGIRTGDVITAYSGRAIESPRDLTRAVAAQAPGTQAPLTVQRGGARQELTVALGQRNEEATAPTGAAPDRESVDKRLGITLAPLDETARRRLGLASGVLVQRIEPDSPAAESGVRPGDIVVAANDREVTQPADVADEWTKARRDCCASAALASISSLP